jgi:hypothetical protein
MIKGKLLKNTTGHWTIVPFPYGSENYSLSPIELEVGDHIEVAVDNFWIPTKIDFVNGHYVATAKWIKLFEGMAARLVKKR